MTDITHEQIRDVLPDALHGKLDEERRRTVESHLRSCAECASEMRVLQMVKDAPSFAPMIDAVKVSSAILPYGGVPVERPVARPRVWQVALAAAAVVIVAVSMFARGSSAPVVSGNPRQVVSVPAAGGSASPAIGDSPAVMKSPTVSVQHSKPVEELQVAVGLEGLSDGSIAQLAREIDGLDGLPSAEPENLGVSDPTAVEDGQ